MVADMLAPPDFVTGSCVIYVAAMVSTLTSVMQAAHGQVEGRTASAEESAGANADAAEEVAQLQAEADEQRQEFGDLLACLGQESAKVNALQELLGEHGIDVSALLAQVAAAVWLVLFFFWNPLLNNLTPVPKHRLR